MSAIERLRIRIKELEAEKDALRSDRDKYRRYFVLKFRWFLELHGNGKTANTTWLVQDMAKFVNTVENFWWGS